MGFSAANFLNRIKGIVTDTHEVGGGYLKDLSLTTSQIATTGTRATESNTVPADVIVIDADAEDVIVSLTVPRDYDEALDHLRVVLLTRYVSGTSIDLGASAVSRATPESDLVSDGNFSVPGATTVNAAFGIGEIAADLSGLGNARHDQVVVNFAASNLTALGIAHVIGARIEYRSTLVSYDAQDANGDNLR